MFVTNVIFEPLIVSCSAAGLVMHAASDGDFVTHGMGGGNPTTTSATSAWTKACFGPLVHDREFADHNRQLMDGWLSAWVPRVLTAARTMQPLWSTPATGRHGSRTRSTTPRTGSPGFSTTSASRPRRSWPSDHHSSEPIRRIQRHRVQPGRHDVDERPGRGGHCPGHERQAGRAHHVFAVDDPGRRRRTDRVRLRRVRRGTRRRAGLFSSADLEESMSTHCGQMVHEDDRTIMFANPEDAAEYLRRPSARPRRRAGFLRPAPQPD